MNRLNWRSGSINLISTVRLSWFINLSLNTNTNYRLIKSQRSARVSVNDELIKWAIVGAPRNGFIRAPLPSDRRYRTARTITSDPGLCGESLFCCWWNWSSVSWDSSICKVTRDSSQIFLRILVCSWVHTATRQM